MALPYEYASAEEVPEVLREEYAEVEVDGKKVYRLDGYSPKEKHHAAIENGRTLNTKNQELQQQLTAAQEELSTLQAKAEDSGKKMSEEKSTLEQRMEALENALTNANTEKAALEQQQQQGRLREAIKRAAVSAVDPDDVADVAQREGWAVEEDGSFVRKLAGKVVYGEDGITPQSPEEYNKDLLTRKPHFYKGSKGDDAPIPGTTMRGGKMVISKSDPAAMGKYADKVATGEVIAE